MIFLLFMSSSGTVQGYDIPFHPFGLDSFDDVFQLRVIIGPIHADFSIPTTTSSYYNYAFNMKSSDGFAFFADTSVELDYLGEFHSVGYLYKFLVAGTMTMTNPTYYASDNPQMDPLLAISGTVCNTEDSQDCEVLLLKIEWNGHYHFVLPQTPAPCEDSDEKFIFSKTTKTGIEKRKNCDWLLTKKFKKKFELCTIPAVSAACPATCGDCE